MILLVKLEQIESDYTIHDLYLQFVWNVIVNNSKSPALNLKGPKPPEDEISK